MDKYLEEVLKHANESAQANYKAGYDAGFLAGLKEANRIVNASFDAATAHDAKLGVDKRRMVEGPRPDQCGENYHGG